jgi:hypothetical protein
MLDQAADQARASHRRRHSLEGGVRNMDGLYLGDEKKN